MSFTMLLVRQLAGSTAWKWNRLPAVVAGGVATIVAMPAPFARAWPTSRNGLARPIGRAPQLPKLLRVEPGTRPLKTPTVAPGLAPLTTKLLATPALPGEGLARTSRSPPCGGPTLIRLTFVSVSEPPGPLTVRLTVKVPAA